MEHRNSTGTAAWAAAIGGAVWALTPLRDQLVGGGGDPADGATFQLHNAVVVAAVLLLSITFVHLLRQATGRSRAVIVSAAIVLLGHGLVAGSVPAVMLGNAAGDLVRAGQDLGFLGALLAAAAAVPLGIIGARRSLLPKTCAVLLTLALPGGLLGAALLAALDAPEDVLGPPMTLLYGGAYVAYGRALLETCPTEPADAGLR